MAMQADKHNIIHSVALEMNTTWIIQWLVVKNTDFWSVASLGD